MTENKALKNEMHKINFNLIQINNTTIFNLDESEKDAVKIMFWA